MDRRKFITSSAALAASTTLLSAGLDGCGSSSSSSIATKAAINPYERSIHFVYALRGGKSLTDTDQALQQALAQVTGGVTALVPFFLNVLNPASDAAFNNMLNWVAANGITLVPAVGGSPIGNTLNNAPNQAIAQGYLALGKHIRLENLPDFYQNPNGVQDVTGFIDYCISLGFTNIMLNPWPYAADGTLATFTPTQMKCIDAAFQSVDPSWQITPKSVSGILQIAPATRILVNYESPGPQQTLAAMETQTPGSSEAAFQTTLTQLAGFPATDNLNWCPPFTQSYDPLSFTPPTWSFIAGKLSQFQ